MSTRHERRVAAADSRYRHSLRRAIWHATKDERYRTEPDWAWTPDGCDHVLRVVSDRIGDSLSKAAA